jgi:hypothetical protein
MEREREGRGRGRDRERWRGGEKQRKNFQMITNDRKKAQRWLGTQSR